LPEIVQFARRLKTAEFQETRLFVRPQTFLFFVIAPLLIACAYQGTIVQKAGRPLPFAYSLGIDASYKFAVRDRFGHVRWQLVSGEVFDSYRVGDYFNDESPTPSRRRGYSKGEKEAPPIYPHETIPIRVPRFQPIPLEPRVVQH
jgi:hypothetical protein